MAIPTQQTADGERVPQRVKRWRRDAVGDRQSQVGDEAVEHLARSAWRQAASAVEAEHRVLGRPAAALDLCGEELADARPVRHEAALAELPTPHDEEPAVGVHVADEQPARLPYLASKDGSEGVLGGRVAVPR